MSKRIDPTCGLLLIITSAYAVGCSAPLTVISQAEPNPFVGQTTFELRDIQYVDLTVNGMSEDAYLESLSEASQADWEEDKDWITQYFRDNVIKAAASYDIKVGRDQDDGKYILVPTIRSIDTGSYTPTEINVTRFAVNVEIQGRSGQTHDEINVEDEQAFDAMFAPSTTGRLQTVAASIGEAVGQYLGSRVEE